MSDGGAMWSVPDLSECVSDEMAEISQEVVLETLC